MIKRQLYRRISLKLAGIIVIAVVIFCVYARYHFGYLMGDYQNRYIVCDPNELLPNLETVFHADIPEELYNVKSAKSVPIRGKIYFIVKFISSPNSVNDFINSFPEKRSLIEIGSYEAKIDRRSSAGFWKPPKWFRKSIQQGEVSRYYLNNRDMYIYIDSTDKASFMVYLHGWYYKSDAEAQG